MKSEVGISFPPFRLDPLNEQLWRGSELLSVRPKPFAVLRYLVEHAGRLVTKAELLKAVWPDTRVSEGVLKGYIGQLREVLGDEAEAPKFIETVARRGYRFIGAITSSLPGQSLRSASPPLTFVGREAKLGQLHRWLGEVLEGKRQIVFVTGEPGIGKTAVVEAFMGQASAQGGLWLGVGQCVARYGAGEAYLPVLDVLGRLGRGPEGERLIEVLGRYAPSWLVQLPALVRDTELEGLQRKVQGTTRERMLREMAEAVEVLTAERPLVLFLEDLQWSDYSTLDLLSLLARRQETARLLVIGTYRPAEMIVSEHPLKGVKQELQVHGQCEELALGFLSAAEVSQYLAARFPQHQFPPELGEMIHQSTEGNPLFMVNVVDGLVARGLVREEGGQWQLKEGVKKITVEVPESLQQMIERQVERLTPEKQRVLEVASIAGAEFSAAAVAAGMEEKVEEVEVQCEGLARRGQFLRSSGMETLPDGTVAGRYAFLHALYQNALYERLTVVRRLRVHRRIGEQREAAYGSRAGEIAAELAMHFEQGQDYERATQYLQRAAESATDRHALREAIRHLTTALELLKILPDTPERTQHELMLQLPLGVALMATQGYATPNVERTYARVRELCRQLGDTPQLFVALPSLRGFHFVRGELQIARELAEQYLALTQRVQAPVLLLWAYYGLGETLLFSGELVPARAHLEQGIACYDPQQVRAFFVRTVQDPGVASLTDAAAALWYLGYPDQALKRIQEALTLAQELSHPFSLAWALNNTAHHHQLRREWELAQEWVEAAITLSSEQGFPYWVARGRILRGRVLAEQGQGEEGIAQIRQGLTIWQATGTELWRPYLFSLLAEAYGKAGQAEEGLTALVGALAAVGKSKALLWEAELYRLKGELLRQKSKGKGQKAKIEAEAEECFRQAIEIARRQSAKSLELRAVMSLSRLWQKQGKKGEARQMLAEIYGWFTEGFDTADLKEAGASLEGLSSM